MSVKRGPAQLVQLDIAKQANPPVNTQDVEIALMIYPLIALADLEIVGFYKENGHDCDAFVIHNFGSIRIDPDALARRIMANTGAVIDGSTQ